MKQHYPVAEPLGGLSGLTRREMLAASAAALASACTTSAPRSCPTATASRPPNIIVYLADALRADALGAYAPMVSFTPCLDAFAKESVVFERCFSNATWTKPSIASLYTGLLKGEHQTFLSDLTQGIHLFPDHFTTLAEAMRTAGYRTGLFLSNAQVSEKMGFRRGFDHYYYELGHPSRTQAAQALEWMAGDREQPFFCFIHELDPHGPYTPEADTWRNIYGTELDAVYAALPELDRELLRQFKYHYVTEEAQPDLRLLSPAGRAYLRCLYHGEVCEMDAAFGMLISALRARGRLDDTVVVLISDHGESLGEYEQFYHMNFMYWPEIHVPAMVRLPGGARPCRVREAVSLHQFYPTLLGLAHAVVPDYVSAPPLLDASGTVNPALPGYAIVQVAHQQPDPDAWLTGIVDGDIRVVWDPTRQTFLAGSLFGDALYTEPEHLPSARQKRVPLLQTQLARELERMALFRKRFPAPPLVPMDDSWNDWRQDLREDLQALGYL